jgi:protein-tyrosine phosphatase
MAKSKAKQQDHVKFEYNKITPLIYLGTNACCQIHFKQELLNKGIRADISIEDERIDQPIGVDYFLWLPVKDHTAPTLKQIWVGVKTIEALLDQKVKIYLHCKNGHGRAPTILAAYFIYQGMSFAEANDKIKQKRNEIHIEKPQKEKLQKFKKYIKNK